MEIAGMVFEKDWCFETGRGFGFSVYAEGLCETGKKRMFL